VAQDDPQVSGGADQAETPFPDLAPQLVRCAKAAARAQGHRDPDAPVPLDAGREDGPTAPAWQLYVATTAMVLAIVAEGMAIAAEDRAGKEEGGGG
jgi:hypothetical protein